MNRTGSPEVPNIVINSSGAGTWRAIDCRYPTNDARCLVAFIEPNGVAYCVVSLIPPVGQVSEVATLGDALIVAQHLCEGEATWT